MLTETSSTDSNPFLVRTVQVPPGRPPENRADIAESIKPLAPIVQEPSTEPPIELYEEKHGVPFVADVFDINNLYGKTGQESLLKAIDAYVLKTIEIEGLKSTKEAYRSIIKDVEDKLGISENLDYPARIEKIYSYTKMLDQERQLKQMRQLFNAY